jgi:hypothetical protein
MRRASLIIWSGGRGRKLAAWRLDASMREDVARICGGQSIWAAGEVAVAGGVVFASRLRSLYFSSACVKMLASVIAMAPPTMHATKNNLCPVLVTVRPSRTTVEAAL